MEIEVIFADFNNADKKGRVRLNTNGSLADIRDKNIELVSGKKIMIDDHQELTAFGILHFSNEENLWVVEINWDAIQYKGSSSVK